MNRKGFLKLLGSLPFLGLAPLRRVLLPMEGNDSFVLAHIEDDLSPEQLDAIQKSDILKRSWKNKKGFFLGTCIMSYAIIGGHLARQTP